MDTIKITNSDLINLKNGVKNPFYNYIRQKNAPIISDILNNDNILRGISLIEIGLTAEGVTVYYFTLNSEITAKDWEAFKYHTEDADEHQGEWATHKDYITYSI